MNNNILKEKVSEWKSEVVKFKDLEQRYIDDAIKIGKEKGNCEELSELCHKAYNDYREGVISPKAYDYVYGICCEIAYPR